MKYLFRKAVGVFCLGAISSFIALIIYQVPLYGVMLLKACAFVLIFAALIRGALWAFPQKDDDALL